MWKNSFKYLYLKHVNSTVKRWCNTEQPCLYVPQNSDSEGECQPDVSPKEQKTTSKPSAAAKSFKLRVALRSAPSTQASTDDQDPQRETKRTAGKGAKKPGNPTRADRMKHVGFEDKEAEVTRPPHSKESGWDSAEAVIDSFLAKREQNIKANKEMVNKEHAPQHMRTEFVS